MTDPVDIQPVVSSLPAQEVDFSVSKRKRSVKAALGSVQAEGLEPGDEVRLLLQEYISGNITAQQLRQNVLKVYTTKNE